MVKYVVPRSDQSILTARVKCFDNRVTVVVIVCVFVLEVVPRLTTFLQPYVSCT